MLVPPIFTKCICICMVDIEGTNFSVVSMDWGRLEWSVIYSTVLD